MKKIYSAFAAICLLSLAGCQEWDPVISFNYPEGSEFVPAEAPDKSCTISIADLKARYAGAPVVIKDSVFVKGQVISEDKSGNIYRSLYIADETAGLEVKVGRSALSNDYKLGQWVYVYCKDLCVGAYGTGVQIGCKDESGEYETAYIASPYLIRKHILRGRIDEPLKPFKITGNEITDEKYFSQYVEISGCTYKNQIFVILYGSADHNTKTYLSTASMGNYGITTWSFSKSKCLEHLNKDRFMGAISEKDLQGYIDNATASSGVSQYFTVPGTSTPLQVRTSGYSKFADTEIPAGVLNKSRSVTFRGILVKYNDNYQLTLIDLESGVTIQ